MSAIRSATRAAAAVTAALAIATAAGGCYRPRAVDCVLVCDEQSACPGHMACSGGLCSSGPACVTSVAAGETHACATVEGGLECWGGNAAGQLGVGDRADRGDDVGELGGALAHVNLGAGRTVPALAFGNAGADGAPLVAGAPGAPVAAGSFHTCARLDGGAVKCWGDNRAGQLGLGAGDRRARVAPGELGDALPAVSLVAGERAVGLAAGVYHTCALLSTGDVKCWGDDRFGQLGRGGGGARDGGAAHDVPWPVDLGAPGGVAAVVAGSYHTCALLVSGEVTCWGWNDYGQLGAGDTRSRGLAAADMGAALPRVALGEGRRAVQIAAGAFHTCARLAGGDLKCWGANNAGQLGLGHRFGRGDNPITLGDGLQVVDLGAGRRARTVAAGGAHTCALLDDFTLRCWGLGADGRLGNGDAAGANRGDEAGEMGSALPPVRLLARGGAVASVATGADHTCAVEGTRVVCFGANGDGRLGTGDRDSRGDGARALVPVDLGARGE